MEPVQLTIIFISATLTLLIVVLGIQVWFILKEMRSAFQKVNKMLDDAGKVSGTVSQGIAGMGSMISGLKAGLSLISTLKKNTEDE